MSEIPSMHLWESIDSLASIPGPVVIALGAFDGLHLGHQEVIARAVGLAREVGGTAVVGTFEPHPMRVLSPSASPLILTSLPHKARILATLGIDHLLVVEFTKDFACQVPEHFLVALTAAARPLGGIVTGADFCFGRERLGNVAMLEDFGTRHGFRSTAVPPVLLDGQRISSTWLRRAVESGDFATCKRLLGRPHTVLGTVQHGQQVGRTIGFPTANLFVHSEQLPPHGVYAVQAWLDNGTPLDGVANLGLRPTVAHQAAPRLEVHLFGFSGDIYGRDLEVRFHRFLRPERVFQDIAELKGQIERDAQAARIALAARQ